MSRLEIPIRRRQELIQATCRVMATRGLEEATVATVASFAGMSAGIVSHYFGSKDGLLEATMRQVLKEQYIAVAKHRAAAPQDCPRSQIRAIIDAHLDPGDKEDAVLKHAWLGFWAASVNKPELRRLQRLNERRMHSNLTFQFRRALPHAQAILAAKGTAAMVTGLWLRGSLSDEGFDVRQACLLIYAYIDERLGIPAST